MHIVHVMASSQMGGGAKYLELLLPELSKRSLKITAITSPGGVLSERLRALGIGVRTPVDMMAYRFNPMVSWKLSQLFKVLKPDLIHFHGTRAAFQGTMLALPCPAIYTAHGAATLPIQSPLRRMLMGLVERKNLRSVRLFSGVSIRDVEAVTGNPAGGIYIPNPVDPRFFATDWRGFAEPLKERKPLVLGTVARLVPQKGLETLLKAAALLSLERPVEVRIVGDGPLRQSLERQAEQAGLTCQFFGALSDPLPVLKAFDICVIPSRWEGQPLSLLEALAAGIPVVTSDCPGLRETAEELDLKHTFTVDDASALHACLRRIVEEASTEVSNECLRLVERMRERLPSHNAERWESIYKSLVA